VVHADNDNRETKLKQISAEIHCGCLFVNV